MITYEVNKADIARVQKKLGNLKSKAPIVIKNAINKTAKDARSEIASGLQAAYTVKIGGITSRIPIQYATAGNLVAILRSRDRTLTVPRFSYRGNKKGIGGAAAGADIVRSGIKPIQMDNIKAFKRGGLIMQRRGPERLPVKVLRSNSVPKMVEKVYKGERGLKGALDEPIKKSLHDNISAEIAKLI